VTLAELVADQDLQALAKLRMYVIREKRPETMRAITLKLYHPDCSVFEARVKTFRDDSSEPPTFVSVMRTDFANHEIRDESAPRAQ
jgi:hypothetical protein